MPTEPVRFLFDFISPYAYLAWTQIHAICERHGRDVEPVPVLFAKLLDHHGQKGPAEIPAKRIHTFKDVWRTAHRLGVTLVPPPSHPFNPLLALRLASMPMPAASRRALIDGLFAATWGGGGGVGEPERVATIAQAAGLDGAALVAQASAPESKERLARQTADAIAAGAFGVPTMLVDGELFWGFDSFSNMELVLRGEDPLSNAALERWKDLPASAQRRANR